MGASTSHYFVGIFSGVLVAGDCAGDKTYQANPAD